VANSESISTPAYRANWRSHAIWRRIFLIALLTYFPGVAALGIFLSAQYQTGTILIVIWQIWAGLLIISGVRIGAFRCPRCGSLFFARRTNQWPYHNILARSCQTCGLRKWATSDPG